MSDASPIYEYTSGTCDVWQLGHLANYYADKGWEPVFAVESEAGIKVVERVGDEDGRDYEAVKPYKVLFRRVLKTEDDEPVNDIEATGRCCCNGCIGEGPCDREIGQSDEESDDLCQLCPWDCQICPYTPDCDCPTHGGGDVNA